VSKLYPCKAEITPSEHMMLIGLLTLAKRNNDANRQLIASVREIIGQDGDRGHADDAVWGDYSAEELLEKMEIKVAKAKKKC